MSELDRLKRLCGLEPNDLAEVLENNPRAYMAVKGAVAEKHLKNYFEKLKTQGSISDFRTASSDFEKDFYITLLDGSVKVVECKNVEVQKVNTKSEYFNYLTFIQKNKKLLSTVDFTSIEDYSLNDLKNIFSALPQSMRESGIPRYEFSINQVPTKSIHDDLSSEEFLTQFDHAMLSIDFQRTRNSRDNSDNDENGKAARFYKLDEIDFVGACLFTRTMKWEFVFGSRESIDIHPKYPDRYSNRLKLNPKFWEFDFLEMLS
ncbi:MAG: hypothetical protein DRI71_01450 [Bacteroidetes bacterium]|nr:MAG: hypothetical protein DRI71_01450 [Bacteroidota bacterium]